MLIEQQPRDEQAGQDKEEQNTDEPASSEVRHPKMLRQDQQDRHAAQAVQTWSMTEAFRWICPSHVKELALPNSVT
jgi:hypothetical protein